jgi:LytS/YehU family sensor histidine kinase
MQLCPDDFELKNLLLVDILLTFLINTIYESFYLFLPYSETALETERYKKESVEAQYQNLTSRLNPHFLFNSLNTLTTIPDLTKADRTIVNSLANIGRAIHEGSKINYDNLNQVVANAYGINLDLIKFE